VATVTSFTKERILEIEAATIVDGAVDGSGHLILVRHDTTTIDAGSVVGPTGATGPAVGPGSIGYTQLASGQRWEAGDFKWSMQPVDHAGWLKMDGRNNFARVGGAYANLFSVVGTTLGAGINSDTFGIGDVTKRVVLGKAVSGVGSTLGGTGGTADAALVQHAHTIANHTHTFGTGDQNQSHAHGLEGHQHYVNMPSAGDHTHDATAGATNVIGTAGGPYNVNGSGSNWVTFDVGHSIRTGPGGAHEHDVWSDGAGQFGGMQNANQGHSHSGTTAPPNDRTTDSPGAVGTDQNLPPFIVMNGFIHM
jgi:Phage Tail Collar Domain